MVRSMPFSGGRAQAPTAPSRRQRFQSESRADQADQDSTSATSSTISPRELALERRRALTSAGKAAVLASGTVAAGRIRTSQDNRRPVPQQPGWVRRGSKRSVSRPVPFNLSRSSLPITHRQHPLTDAKANGVLRAYEDEVKGRFDRIVPLLQKVSALQHDTDFIEQAQRMTRAELGFDLPQHVLDKSWVRPLDMRALSHGACLSPTACSVIDFSRTIPSVVPQAVKLLIGFEQFLLECGSSSRCESLC